MEIWKLIPGFDAYEVSNQGNVRRADKILKGNVQTNPNDGYKSVRLCLCKEGIKSVHIVARLIAKAFIPNPDNLPEVDHIDKNSLNNNVTNLRWVTKQEQNLNRDMPLGKSGHRYIRKHRNKWWVQIWRHKQHVFRKGFYTLKEAEEARDDMLAILGDPENDPE